MTIKTHGYDVTRNTSADREPIKYIVLHYTATDRATAKNETMFFATNTSWQALNASADFAVDDNEVWQYNTQIDTRYCWAVGDGSAGTYGDRCTNANSVSIEMCCYLSGNRWYIGEKTYQNALALTKHLMQKYGVSSDRVIRHYDVSTKWCPNAVGWLSTTGSEATWKKFKAALGSAATPAPTKTNVIYRVQCGAFSVKANAVAFCETLKKKGYKDAFVLTISGGISDIRYRVQCGAFSVRENAENYKKKLQADGIKDAFVTMNGQTVSTKKTTAEVAREVIAGKWGVGEERKKKLTAAGYNYTTVQAEVNRILKG